MIIIANPAAGRRHATRLARVLAALQARGVRFEVVATGGPGHATALARQGAREGGIVAAAGGDGTVAEVAAGLAGSDARLGVIPIGSANVLARELGLEFSPGAVAETLAAGRHRMIWPGVITSGAGSRLFLQMAGIGLDARVVHALPPRLKRVLGRGAYAWQAVREVGRGGSAMLPFCLDGTPVPAAAAIISKGRLYGGRFILAPEAEPGEPGFHVTLTTRAGRLPALLHAAALPCSLLPRAPFLARHQARHIALGAPAPIQADGDPAGHGPCHVADAPAPIRVVV